MHFFSLKKFQVLGLLVTSILVISGCFNFGSNPGTTTSKPTANDRIRTIDDLKYDFTIQLPREWDVIEKKDFTADVPPETVVVFRNNIKNEDFTANVSIIRTELQTPKETLEYAKEVINRQKNGLYNYKETKRDLVKIQIGDKNVDTYLTYFEAKKDPGNDVVKFMQTYAVKNNAAYIALGAMSTKENDNNAKTVEDIIKSWKLK